MTLVSQTLARRLAPRQRTVRDATVIISGTCRQLCLYLTNCYSSLRPGARHGVRRNAAGSGPGPGASSCSCKVAPGAWLRVAMTAATSCTGCRRWRESGRPSAGRRARRRHRRMISISVGADRARVRPSLPSTSPSRSGSVRLAVGKRRFLLATVGPAHVDARRLLVEGGLDQLPAQLGPAGHRLAVDRYDAYRRRAGRPCRRRLLGHGRELARRLFDAMHEQAREQHDGEEEIGQRAGGDDGDAAPHVLAREFAAQLAFRQVAAGLASRLSSI